MTPKGTALLTLDYGYRGAPFADVAAKGSMSVFQTDIAYRGMPFMAPSPDMQQAYPASDIATNNWTPSTVGSALYAMLDETSTPDDADWINSPINPTTQQFEVKLQSLTDPTTGVNHILTIRLRSTGVGVSTTFDLYLVQGTSVLDSWSETVTAAEGWVDRQRVLTETVADSITDYTDLRVRGVAKA